MKNKNYEEIHSLTMNFNISLNQTVVESNGVFFVFFAHFLFFVRKSAFWRCDIEGNARPPQMPELSAIFINYFDLIIMQV